MAVKIKRLILLWFGLLAAALTLSGQQAGLDSARVAALDAKLSEYFTALETQSAAVKVKECDFLIESCTDEDVRQHVALRIYDHYLTSNVMGDETVAVHMVDEWFTPGKVKMIGELDLLNAQVYAQFTRSSLVGNQAPVLQLRERDGSSTVTAPQKGTLSVLFFYDVTCAKCKLETLRLRSLLPEIEYPIEFYAVFTGVYKEQWESYIAERWNFETKGVNIHHLWDPEIESNFQINYGVMQTPQMVLVGKDGTILGRHLDTDALKQLLDAVIPQPYEYGDPKSMAFYERLFAEGEPSASDLLEMADYIKKQTLATGDTLLCKHLMGDYLYYLSDSQGEEYKYALLPFIKLHIDGEPQLWTEPKDVTKVLKPAEVMKDLLARVPVGSRIPSLKVEGILKTLAQKGQAVDALPVKKYRLRGLRGMPTYLVFHTPGCGACEDIANVADLMFDYEPKAKFLFVEPTEALLDIFDLSVLPHVIQLDRKGKVERKYIKIQ